MFDGREFCSSSTECFSASSFSSSSSSKKKKIKSKSRFTNEQIKSLETMFESETKLEPRKKLQIAKELGLQPRQVAIWFQNKRARYKSKQLEKDYDILMSNYNNLSSQYESLKKEKQSLVMQVQQLNDLLQKSQKNEQCFKQEFGEIDIDRKSDNGHDIKNEMNDKPTLSFDLSEHGIGVISDDDSSRKADYFGVDEDHDFLNKVEPADGTLTSPENWGSLDNDSLLDQPNTNYDWWEFWS